jgi:hypothetical protein
MRRRQQRRLQNSKEISLHGPAAEAVATPLGALGAAARRVTARPRPRVAGLPAAVAAAAASAAAAAAIAAAAFSRPASAAPSVEPCGDSSSPAAFSRRRMLWRWSIIWHVCFDLHTAARSG